MKIKCFLSIIILIATSFGCATLQPQKNYSSAKKLSFPTERRYDDALGLRMYDSIGLYENQIIIFDNETIYLYYALEDSKEFTQIPDKRNEFCLEDDYWKSLSYNSNVIILPDQRVGLTGDCKLNETYMFAYDIKTGKMEKIVNEQLPVPANNFSWNPTMTKGVQDSYTRLNGTIFWLDREKASAIDIKLSDGNRSWSLAKGFPDLVDDEKQGIAAYPIWSLDGKQIAFIATFDSIGLSGFSILDSEYYLYIMDVETLTPTRILEGIHQDYPIKLSWSPDGNYISFIGKYGFSQQYGLWVLNLESRNVYFIDKHVVENVWRNDGKSIVGIKCIGNPCEKQEVWEYWLNDLK